MKPACKKNKKPRSNVSARKRKAEEGNLKKRKQAVEIKLKKTAFDLTNLEIFLIKN